MNLIMTSPKPTSLSFRGWL